jgi:hypothetical protein
MIHSVTETDTVLLKFRSGKNSHTTCKNFNCFLHFIRINFFYLHGTCEKGAAYLRTTVAAEGPKWKV